MMLILNYQTTRRRADRKCSSRAVVNVNRTEKVVVTASDERARG